MSLLDKIITASNLKSLSVKELKTLSDEVRQKIIDVIGTNGGHLSSNLGVVETTIALHYVFDLPSDKLLFDVGHQCYAHKMLSNRLDKFHTIRTDGGLSGFPNKTESEYDNFTVGHAGTSIASSLGLCSARDSLNQDYFVIDVVGDGSFVNGLNLEALYAKDFKPRKYILILNDNGMSISKNKNGFYKYLTRRTIGKSYRASKKAFVFVFRNSFVTKIFRKLKSGIKRVLKGDNHLENFGFKYVGVVDGNDVESMVSVLRNVKETANSQAVLLHIKTTKGKGLLPAEENSDLYHGVGKNLVSKNCAYSRALGKHINALIEKDNRVVAITAGMKDGTGLKCVEDAHPENFYDVGIAEEYAVTYSAGLATGGLRPIVAVYSTFMQRAYDQILHDVCLQNLPVIFCLDRAGFVGADGETHQGVFDLSYLSHLPNLTIIAPTTPDELTASIDYAIKLNSPVVIRYPNESGATDRGVYPFKKGGWERLEEGRDVTILAVGPRMLRLGLKIKKELDKSVGIISARIIKPLDGKMLDKIKNTLIVTLEENSVIGGFGSSVGAYYRQNGYGAKVLSFGVKDEFVPHGSVEKQMEINGLTVENVTAKIIEGLDK